MQRWEYCVIGPIQSPSATLSFPFGDHKAGPASHLPGHCRGRILCAPGVLRANQIRRRRRRDEMGTVRYEYTSVGQPTESRLEVSTTYPELLNWIWREVQRVRPQGRLWGTLEDISGQSYSIGIKVKGWNDGQALLWWLNRYLCHQGWEPLNGAEFRLKIGGSDAQGPPD